MSGKLGVSGNGRRQKGRYGAGSGDVIPQTERLQSVPGPLSTEQLVAVAAHCQQKGLVKLQSTGNICSGGGSTRFGAIPSRHLSASSTLSSQVQMPFLADDLEAQLAGAFLLQLQLQPDVASHFSGSSVGVQLRSGSNDGGGRTVTIEERGDTLQQHTWLPSYHQPSPSSWPPSMPLQQHAPKLSYRDIPWHQEPQLMPQHVQNLYQQNELVATVQQLQRQQHLQSVQAMELSSMQRQEQQQLQQIQHQHEQDFAVVLQNVGFQVQLQAQQMRLRALHMDQLMQLEIAKVQQCALAPATQEMWNPALVSKIPGKQVYGVCDVLDMNGCCSACHACHSVFDDCNLVAKKKLCVSVVLNFTTSYLSTSEHFPTISAPLLRCSPILYITCVTFFYIYEYQMSNASSVTLPFEISMGQVDIKPLEFNASSEVFVAL